jgi:hypothetical protein
MRRLIPMGLRTSLLPRAEINERTPVTRHVHGSAYPITIDRERSRGGIRATIKDNGYDECCSGYSVNPCMDFVHVVHTGATLT